MEQWLKNRLSKCLNFKVPDDMISYILTLETAEEIDQHFKTLLNYNLRGHRYFVYEFKQRKFNNFKNEKENLVKTSIENDKKCDNQNENEEIKNKKPELKNLQVEVQDNKITSTFDISGRHPCDCQASKHKLINNCRKCGRIICQKEGIGPCLFCGNFVNSIEEPKFIKDPPQQLDNLKSNLFEQNQPKCSAELMKQNDLQYVGVIKNPTAAPPPSDESNNFKRNVRSADSEKKKHDNLKENLYEQNQPKCSAELMKQNGLQYVGVIKNPTAAPPPSDESNNFKRNVRSADSEKKKHDNLKENLYEQNQPKCSAESMKQNGLQYVGVIEKRTAAPPLNDESINFKRNVRFADSEKEKHDNLKENLYEQNQPKCSVESLKLNDLQYVGAIEKSTAARPLNDESINFKTNFVRSSDSEKKKHELLEEKRYEVVEESKHEREEEIRVNKHANRLLKKITIDFTGKEIYEGPIITIEYKT